MPDLALVLTFTLAAIVLALFAFATAALYALCKGCVALRRSLRAASHEFGGVLLKSPIVPGVSVLYSPGAPSAETRAIVRRLLDLHFANSELVLVLDGPSEADRNFWMEELRLVPQARSAGHCIAAAKVRGFYVSRDPLRVLVVDKEPGGRGDALNAGVNAARYAVFGLVDAEADFVPEVLLALIRPMLQDWERMQGVCGAAPALGGSGLAGRIGAIESLRCWLARGGALSASNRLVPVPGCCMLVKRDAVLAEGGFSGGPLELFLGLHSAARARSSPCQMGFVGSPISWRTAANCWGDVRRQVMRDQLLLTMALRHHGPGAGREFLGLFLMRVMRPLLETAGLMLAAAGLIAGMIQPALAALLLLSSAGSGVVISMAAVVLSQIAQPGGIASGSLAALFFTSIPENLGYRQLRNLWLIGAFFTAPAAPKMNRRII